MTQRKVVYAGVIIAFLLSASLAHAFELGVRGYYWFPSFRGDIKIDKDNLKGTEFSAKDLMDVGNRGYPSLEAYGGIGKHHLSLMYTQIGHSKDNTLSFNVNFAGKTYPVGTKVDADLTLRVFDLEYQYDVFKFKPILAGFAVGVLGKLKYIDGESSLSAPVLGKTKENYGTIVPMVGLGAHLGLLANLLEARAKVSGMAYSGNVYLDAMADVSVTPFPFLDIHAGYRVMKIKMDKVQDVTNDFFLAGPYIGLSVGF
ncbi:MAG: hypothetical protein N2572_05085 [Syntrophales bacterium]|nr:hypothetical protein [Syntrophales bacterium]